MTNEEKILQMLGNLTTDMATMKSDIAKRFDSMDKRMDSMETKINALEESQGNIYAEIRRTHVMVEHQDHNISLIAEQYGDIAKKLDKANERAAQVEDLQDRVRTLETVVMNHTAATVVNVAVGGCCLVRADRPCKRCVSHKLTLVDTTAKSGIGQENICS